MGRYALLVLVLLLVAALAIPSLAETEILDADMATLDLTISNEFTIMGTGPNPEVNTASASLSWFPRESFNQEILSVSTTPLARTTSEATIFAWTRPSLGKQRLTLTAELKTRNDVLPVTRKVPFPLEGIGEEFTRYIEPSEMIVINDDIRDLAAQLAQGKSDEYEVVFAFADWVTTNIAYNLSSLTAEATYPSDWVLDRRYGVCDELTNLFISLNRASGIPARFVSGLAYTTMPEVPDNWGGHGWAEAYFPGFGWAPFDVTYGEYGYLDAGHIKLKDSTTSKESSVQFSATGVNVNLVTRPLEFDVQMRGERQRPYDLIEATLEPYAEEVGFGSYNLLTLTLRNLRSHYVSTRVELGRTARITHESPDVMNVLLKPRETKRLHFLVKVDDLESGYIYTFPIAALTKLTSPAETSFRAVEGGPILQRDLFEEYFAMKKREGANLALSCRHPASVKPGPVEVLCTVENKEGRTLQLEGCVNGACEGFSLPQDGEKTFVRTLELDEPGAVTIPVVVRNKDLLRTTFVVISVLDETTFTISNITNPKTLGYDDRGELRFIVHRESFSVPETLSVRVENGKFAHEWETTLDAKDQEFILGYRGKNLKAGDNTIRIVVEYTDRSGEPHTETQDVHVMLTGLTLWQRIELWFDGVERWMEGIF